MVGIDLQLYLEKSKKKNLNKEQNMYHYEDAIVITPFDRILVYFIQIEKFNDINEYLKYRNQNIILYYTIPIMWHQ